MNKEIQITLDSFEALHTVKALAEYAESLKTNSRHYDAEEKFLMNDHAEMFERVTKRLSSAMWKAGVTADVTIYRN